MTAAVFASSAQEMPKKPDCDQSYTPRLCTIHSHVRATAWFNKRTGRPLPHYRWLPEKQVGRRDHWVTYWRGRRLDARKHYVVWMRRPWLRGEWLRAALCVHRLEGAWDSNTGNGFYGGFQYLQSTWVASGGLRFASRADLATPAEQLRVTYGVTTRYGWGQWPNTAAACGLLR